MKDFEWLNDLLNAIPDKPEYKKNIFDIAGFPRWETVNSNLLAFYFDKTEEHNFNTLFIESLLNIVSSNLAISIEDDFDVHREYRTDKGNYIDLVIKSVSGRENENADIKNTDWAVIIENKVDSGLQNDLHDYWKSIKAKNKLGVVISKHKFNLEKHKNFIAITHQELINEVQKNLFQYFSDSNEKHLLFLKEYINNINSFYLDEVMDLENDILLQQFYNYKEEINRLKKADTKLLEYLSKNIFEVFESKGFNPYSNKSSASKHFYPQTESMNLNEFRFWIDISHMRYNKSFLAHFELHDKVNTKYGSILKERLRNKKVYSNYVTEGKGGGDKGVYNQIYTLRIPVEVNEKQSFKEGLEQSLSTHFFNHSSNFINQAIVELVNIKQSF
ncbi:PD-(D/E)XK nuclease family protein [Tenacibaculum singaporense]|uniref:PD-(D/E)XK nuclease family protein n=1 Tax=Tenacibaculum singaporense TaxID=2358479 RepID=UPI0035111ADC